MSKNKKFVPVSGIIFSVFTGLLVIIMFIGLMFSCNPSADDDKEKEVNYGSYRVSELW